MKKVIRTKEQLNKLIEYIKQFKLVEPITINIEKLYNKRSAPQLRSFWLLINIVKLWMNEQGNNFTSEEVATYFKLQAGHYKTINGVKIAKSIADKSDTTKEDMKNIIDCILEFGINNNIEDCYIDNYELNELLNYYR